MDGHLFAVSVVDVLPEMLSSVYVFYDPDYSFLSPGVLTALKEIDLMRCEAETSYPMFQFYVLGYYVERCPKMMYKADYQPCELLCPETLLVSILFPSFSLCCLLLHTLFLFVFSQGK